MFITTFTSARNLSLSWASSIHSINPNHTSCRPILILSSHLRLGSPVASFPQVSPPKPSIQLPTPPYAPHDPPTSLFLFLSPELYWVRNIDHQAPHYVVFSTSCHFVSLRSKYSPQHIILKHPKPTFLLQISDHVLHPYNTTDRIILLYFLIFKFFDNKLQETRFKTEW